MRAEASFVSFSPPRAFLSRFLIGEKAEPLQKHAGSYSSRCAFARLCVYAHAQGRGGTQRPGGSGFRPSNMAPTMLVLLVPPLPVARGLLWNCWKQLQQKLLQSRPGFPSPPLGPALAVQGPAIFSEPTNDTSGSTETSSLLDSIFWMAAPKNRRSIEVNRCRRRNPHKLIKVKVIW